MKKLLLTTSILFFLTSISCNKNDEDIFSTPIVANETTETNSEITFTTIQISGKVVAATENTISSRGVCWSKNPNPTINDSQIKVETNTFTVKIEDLIVNTNYYYRIFAITPNGVIYSNTSSFTTLSFENTNWIFSTYYPVSQYSTGTTIESNVNFYDDGTTKFDEIGVGQGYFITYGSWYLNGNELTYIWEGDLSSPLSYKYTGTLSGMTMQGTYNATSFPDGTWHAVLF